MKTTNPATVSGRVRNIDVLGRAIDNRNPTENPSESLAALKLSARFRVGISTARVIAELAGIGPSADRETLFPFTTFSQPSSGSHSYGA